MEPAIKPSREAIEQALNGDAFLFEAEPIIEVATRRIFAEEVLIRLNHEGRVVYPQDFIKTAELSDLAPRLDLIVLQRMLTRPRGHWSRAISMNLSAVTVSDAVACEAIHHALAMSRADLSHLIFEITESAAIADLDHARHFITRVKKLGVRTAIDDFGAGNASLNYLRHLPVDFIKIDGHYVRNIADSGDDWKFFNAMVAMVAGLGKEIIAEWVESQAAFELLRVSRVRYAQGHHVQRMLNQAAAV